MTMILSTSHVPFRELPLQARWLFYIFALGAYASYRSVPPTIEEVAIALELIWNRNRLSPSALNPPGKVVDLLREEFSGDASSARG